MPIGFNHDMQGETVSVQIVCDACGEDIRDLDAAVAVGANAQGFQTVRVLHNKCDREKNGEFRYELNIFVADLGRLRPKALV